MKRARSTPASTCAAGESGSLNDDDARTLATPLDGAWLANLQVSTWRTDAGDFDVLTTLPTTNGARASSDDLVERAVPVVLAGVRVLVAGLGDIIAAKEWADRPKD